MASQKSKELKNSLHLLLLVVLPITIGNVLAVVRACTQYVFMI